MQYDQDKNLRSLNLDFYHPERSLDRNLCIKNEGVFQMIFLLSEFDPYYKIINSMRSHSSFIEKNISTFSYRIFWRSKLGYTRVIEIKPLVACWVSKFNDGLTCKRRYSGLLL